MSSNTPNYDLPSDAYLSFDAQSLKELIIRKLNESGQFQGHEYEGSNFSAVIDVIAYTYHLLLFYLNRMGTEATFTQTQIYENMNRIVKLLGYNPIGYQTPCVSFTVSAPDISTNNNGFELNTIYTIPRFSYINVNGIKYVLTKDVTFSLTDNDEIDDNNNHILADFSNSNILFQGDVVESQTYYALGDKFETYTLVPANNSLSEQFTIVDFSNFSVYVYNIIDGVWQEWTETSSLYLESDSALKYEKRLNEAGYYEFKFGNNVNGKQLNQGDAVQIYYLRSSGTAGEIGVNQLNTNPMNLYHTVIFDSIIQGIFGKNNDIIQPNNIKTLQFKNNTVSTKFTYPESVDEIRNNLSKVFHSQSQLITAENIQTYIERNFSNITSSVYVMNNDTYINDVMSYYYSLGVGSINKDSRISLSQLQFSTSCNFNNIYVYMIPKHTPVDNNNIGQFVDSNLKQYLVEKLDKLKPLTSEIVPMDPIYMAVGFGVQNTTDTIFTQQYSTQLPDDIINSTKLILTRFSNSRNKVSVIKAKAIEIIQNIFNNAKLGYTISTTEIIEQLNNIEGVKSIHTERNNIKVNGVSLMVWNPIYYNKDISITTNPVIFDNFKFPFLYNATKLADYIDVQISE